MNSEQIRAAITEALQIQDGLKSGELIQYMPQAKKQLVYQVVHDMKSNGLITCNAENRYFLVTKQAEKTTRRIAPYQPSANGHTNGHTPNAAQTVNLATYQQGRKGKQVMVIAAPVYHDDVVKVELCGVTTFSIPMFGGLTICTGPDIPKLSPDQETYRHLKEIRLHFRNGQIERIPLSETQVITIAPIQVQE